MLHIVHKINLCAAAACWKALSHFVYFLSLSLSRCVSAACYVPGSLLYSANVSLIAIAVLFTWQCLWCRDPVWRNLQYENVHSLLDRCVFFSALVCWLSCCFPLHVFPSPLQFSRYTENQTEQSRTNSHSLSFSFSLFAVSVSVHCSYVR